MNTPKPKRKCSVEECDRPHRARGYCQQHWQRWKKGWKVEGAIGPLGYNRNQPEQRPLAPLTNPQRDALVARYGRLVRHYYGRLMRHERHLACFRDDLMQAAWLEFIEAHQKGTRALNLAIQRGLQEEANRLQSALSTRRAARPMGTWDEVVRAAC